LINCRDTVERYATEVERVARELLSLFAENLHLGDADYFKNVFGSEPMNLMRMNLYPPCPRPDLVLGLSPHSDGGGITLLLQDDETQGLHVRKNNQWIPVEPIPYALVINIGDLVEVIMSSHCCVVQTFHLIGICFLENSFMGFHGRGLFFN
jgi:isopenicillin N synthase-like dioxygenase